MKQLLIICMAAFSLGWGNRAAAQSDNPCGATVLTPLPAPACVFQLGTNIGSTNSPGVPAPLCANYSGNDVWYRVTVPANGALTINMNTGTITDSGMAWYRGACGALTLIECDDDDSPNGAMSMIASTCLTPGETIYVRIWRYGGGTGTFNICATTPIFPTPNNSLCANMSPICSGSPISFPALSGNSSAFICNPGNNYGCLITTPNPTWYYLEILNGGNLAVDMSAASDIDFALWGPYANLTAAKAACGSLPAPIDCSYSTAPTEQANASGTMTTQIYVMVVTNYANVPQTITVNTSGSSTATTNCGIVILPVELSAFDVQQVGRDVRLDWTTESELNSSHFLIERSADGQVWQTIGMQIAAGNSQEKLEYSFTDDSGKEGVFYYRLRQVDNNGNYDYSPVRSVQVALEYRFEIWPNPADEFINIGLEDNDELLSIELYSVTGTKVPLSYTVLKGYAQLDCAPLRAGTYQVVVQTEKHLSRQLIVIK